MTKELNRLTGLQRHRLYSWIETNRELVAAKTDAALLEEMSLELGMKLTSSNVGDARRTLGIMRIAPASKTIKFSDVEADWLNKIQCIATCIDELYHMQNLVTPSRTLLHKAFGLA